MKMLQVTTALLAGALMLIPAVAASQDGVVGKAEYDANCAVCHGISGHGDGPLTPYVTAEVADLTVLAKNNDGVFPSGMVREVIDGRREYALHGSRDMPIWGDEFNAEAADYYREVWSVQDPESMVQSRIDGLVAYIESLQQ